MSMTKTTSSKVFNIFNTIFLFIYSFLTIVPLVHVLMGSLSDPVAYALRRGLRLLPAGFSLEGYRLLLETPLVWRGYLNSIIYVSITVVLGLTLSILGAYVISRKGLLLNKFFILMILFTMVFPPGMIPMFLLIRYIGWMDSPLSIIIPRCVTVFGLIIIRTAFLGIPESLEESAKIDGASPFRVLVSIILPLSKATIAVIALFYSIQHWNAFFEAMIYLQTRSLFPLQLILRELLILDVGTDAIDAVGAMRELLISIMRYSTVIVAIIPMVIAYPFIQKHFVKGIMIGAVKG